DSPKDWPIPERQEILSIQLGWARQRGANDLDRPLGDVHKAFLRYAAYRGLCACYSGHKSVHIHIVFDTTEVFAGEDADLAGALGRCYESLYLAVANLVQETLKSALSPDTSMKNPTLWKH